MVGVLGKIRWKCMCVECPRSFVCLCDDEQTVPGYIVLDFLMCLYCVYLIDMGPMLYGLCCA